MNLHALISALGGLLVIFTAGCGKSDQEKIQGTWEVTSFILNGRESDDAKGAKITFAGDKMTQTEKSGEKREFTFKLDPSQSPRGIDATATAGPFQGKLAQGIYQIDGDNLKLCLPNDPSIKDRPKAFGSPEGSKLVEVNLKRSK